MSAPCATAAWTPERAVAVGRELEGASTGELVAWAAGEFGTRLAVASSMQDAVLAHVVGRELPGVDVLFLDTGYHFEQTLAMRDEVARRLPVTVVSVQPPRTVAEQDAEHGPRLHARDPDTCCFLRKVDPLARALEGYSAWVSGTRRADSPARSMTPVVGWDRRHGIVKVNPLAAWTDADVAAYQERHGLPRNPLVDAGFLSVGCAPCTRAVAPGEDPRAGRWAGTGKTECGIHG